MVEELLLIHFGYVIQGVLFCDRVGTLFAAFVFFLYHYLALFMSDYSKFNKDQALFSILYQGRYHEGNLQLRRSTFIIVNNINMNRQNNWKRHIKLSLTLSLTNGHLSPTNN